MDCNPLRAKVADALLNPGQVSPSPWWRTEHPLLSMGTSLRLPRRPEGGIGKDEIGLHVGVETLGQRVPAGDVRINAVDEHAESRNLACLLVDVLTDQCQVTSGALAACRDQH